MGAMSIGLLEYYQLDIEKRANRAYGTIGK
jgi:hypothetical protein